MRGLYQPKNYTEEEKLQGLLFLRLGGSRVAELAHQSLSTLGVSMLRHCSVLPPLWTVSTVPSLANLQHNLQLFFSSPNIPARSGGCSYALMIDEIVIERQPQWDDRSNQVLGLCHEHSHRIGTEFCSIEQAHELCDAISGQEVHFASEATIAAIGILSENPHIYSVLPFLISGTCKREDADTHAKLIESLVRAYGESRHGSALMQITQKHSLSPDLTIYPLLSKLRFLNLLVGDEDLMVDKDYKHVIKRLRNFLLRKRGTMVHGTHITPLLLWFHLKLASISENRLTHLFNPND
ncbi:hypothetical protein APHAL10511_004966 [Amanita phalloides]|nr:hypothetical protein APHAL10511_004966 [Amanita phalloides]